MSTRIGDTERFKKKSNLMGKLLSKIQLARWKARQDAVTDIWKRNNLDNPTKRQGYKLEELKTLGSDGQEVIRFQLWQLLDQSVITISSEIKSEISTGIPKGVEDDVRGEEEVDPTSSPI